MGNVLTKALIAFLALHRLELFVTSSGATFHNFEPSLISKDSLMFLLNLLTMVSRSSFSVFDLSFWFSFSFQLFFLVNPEALY